LYREFRRHAGDDRLPSTLRQALRVMADRAHANALAMRAPTAAFPRRLLREPTKISMAPAVIEQARAHLSTYGFSDGSPLVVFDVRTRPDIATALIRFLAREGYIVVTTGNHASNIGSPNGVIDLTMAPRSLAIEMFALSVAAFAVCGSTEMQRLAYLTGTPSLTINARDPFSAYPVRADCRFTLRTAIDLDTGRVLGIDELLTDRYFRNLRNCGYRDNTADELIEAVAEIRARLAGGWTETQSQARFRSRVAQASLALEPTFPFVAEWGADGGFIGDGALARFQADRAS
jgi:putative glycosyltransferase (TIGR04372 family)